MIKFVPKLRLPDAKQSFETCVTKQELRHEKDRRRAMLTRLLSLIFLLAISLTAQAYVEIPYTLGRLVTESTHVMLVQVDKVDKTKNLIIYRKVKDIKGTHPTDVIKHNIGQAGFSPKEWQSRIRRAATSGSRPFSWTKGPGRARRNRYLICV